MSQDFAEFYEQVVRQVGEVSDSIAETTYNLYQSYIEAGFTEEQAFELLKHNPIEVNGEV